MKIDTGCRFLCVSAIFEGFASCNPQKCKARILRKRGMKCVMSKSASASASSVSQVRKGRKYSWYNIKRNTARNWPLLIMVLPALAFYILFHYVPMGGLLMAFEDFKPKLGLFGSPFVGLENFTDFFSSVFAWRTIRNTLILSLLQIGIEFPITIIFALLLNELRSKRYKRLVQTVSYMPYFVSMVVMAGIIVDFCSTTGPLTQASTRSFMWLPYPGSTRPCMRLPRSTAPTASSGSCG